MNTCMLQSDPQKAKHTQVNQIKQNKKNEPNGTLFQSKQIKLYFTLETKKNKITYAHQTSFYSTLLAPTVKRDEKCFYINSKII